MKRVQSSVRIIPAKAQALFTTLVFAGLLFAFYIFLLHDLDTVIINGKDVHRPSQYRLIWMSLFLALPVFGLITQALRLLPGSPFDFLEIGPEGFTVGKLFGRRHRPWDEISGFSTGSITLSKPPITWVKVEAVRPMRFFVLGYVRLKLFSSTDAQIREIADWLDQVRESYSSGDGALPIPPEAFAGTIIPLTGYRATPQSRSSVIERRTR
ncbi:hypothetical protein [Dongia sp.]|uniref:hypothetical protein n=1 Tax=Dongia sp. TaxID=1977262 RepID=UPI003750E787